MKKEQLIKILQDNDVKFNEALLRESVAGYPSDENAECAEKLYGDLFILTTYGLNNGFNRVRGAIAGISDLISKLISSSKNVLVSIAKIEDKRQKILKEFEGLKDMSVNMDMKDQLMQNLDDCIAVTDAITGIRKDNEDLCARLAESKRILLEMKASLEHVVDATSVKASEYQVAVFETLMEWRQAVSRYQCYSDIVQKLEQALASVKDWCGLTTVKVGRHSRAKADVDYYVYSPSFDSIHSIVISANKAERTNGLRYSLAEYRKATEKLYNVDGKRAEMAEIEKEYFEKTDRLNARIGELTKTIETLISQYQNGEIDAVVSVAKIKDHEAEIERCKASLTEEENDYNYRVSGLRNDWELAEKATRIRNNLAKEFEDFVNTLETIRVTDPAKFVLLCSRLDFDKIYDALSGRLPDQDLEELFVSIEAIINAVNNDIAKQRAHLDSFVTIKRRAIERMRTGESDRTHIRPVGAEVTSGATHADKTAQAESAMEMLAKKYGLGGSVQPVKEDSRQGESEGTIHIDNDDK